MSTIDQILEFSFILTFSIKQQVLFKYLLYRVTFWKEEKGRESVGPQQGEKEILHIFSMLYNMYCYTGWEVNSN